MVQNFAVFADRSAAAKRKFRSLSSANYGLSVDVVFLQKGWEATPRNFAPAKISRYTVYRDWKERVYPCTLGSLLLTGKKECTPTLKCSCILIYTGKKECTPTLKCPRILIYTGKKECTPTLFPASITQVMTSVYPDTILTPSFTSITGRKECTPTLFPSSVRWTAS